MMAASGKTRCSLPVVHPNSAILFVEAPWWHGRDAGLTHAHRGSETHSALSRTGPLHLEKGLGQPKRYPRCAECGQLAPASITGSLSAHQSSAAAIISTATPSQWENLLGDALCHAQRWLAPVCGQVHPVQRQTQQLSWFLFPALGTSTLGSRRKCCLLLFLMDSAEPDVVHENNTGGGFSQASPELSAAECFSWSERFKGKQLLDS